VVVVDAHDEAEAERARKLLVDLEAGELNVVHRPEQRPLRDIVGMQQELRDERAAIEERSRQPYVSGPGDVAPNDAAALERERAMAANRVTPTTGPELRDPELGRPPGLRYGDKDKPNG
jgi:hypothetical protein